MEVYLDAYRYLAKVYDSLMSDVDYPSWAQYLHGFLLGFGAKNVLEVSCGTGNITFALSRLGYNITASDISLDMLKIAKLKNTRLCEDVTFVQFDMRSFKVGNQADAVVCACDGVNYIDKQGLIKFVQSAYAAIKPGGILLFDLSSVNKLKNIMDGQVFFDERDDIACIWKNTFDETAGSLSLDVTLFIKNGELYEREHELHKQYAHETSFVTAELMQAGFNKIDVFDCFTQNAPDAQSQRLQFVCYKV
jgi:SAM-dependent methyltransferase